MSNHRREHYLATDFWVFHVVACSSACFAKYRRLVRFSKTLSHRFWVFLPRLSKTSSPLIIHSPLSCCLFNDLNSISPLVVSLETRRRYAGIVCHKESLTMTTPFFPLWHDSQANFPPALCAKLWRDNAHCVRDSPHSLVLLTRLMAVSNDAQSPRTSGLSRNPLSSAQQCGLRHCGKTLLQRDDTFSFR